MADAPNIPTVQLSQSQQDAIKCPTCHREKEWKGDKPGSAPKPSKAPGQRFRAMQATRGRGRPRMRPRDPRNVIFY